MAGRQPPPAFGLFQQPHLAALAFDFALLQLLQRLARAGFTDRDIGVHREHVDLAHFRRRQPGIAGQRAKDIAGRIFALRPPSMHSVTISASSEPLAALLSSDTGAQSMVSCR